MTREEFSVALMDLLNTDSPKTNYATGYRTFTDQEAQRFVEHCYELFRDLVRHDLSVADLLPALLGTRRCTSEQDRAEAMSRLLYPESKI